MPSGKFFPVLQARVLRLLVLLAVMASWSVAQALTMSGTYLTTVDVRPDLGSNVQHSGQQQVYNNNAYGTFLAVNAGGASNTWPLFGPSAIGAGSSATGSAGYAVFTPVGSQTASGTGTAADPFAVNRARLGRAPRASWCTRWIAWWPATSSTRRM